MKKWLSIFMLSFFVLVFPSQVEAKVIVKEEGSVVIEADEVIEDDLFIGAESVEILGKVDGDVFVGTATFNMSGEITGDLFVGAGTVNISGVIGDDLRIGSGNVNITSTTVDDGAIIGAGTVNIDSESSIGGTLLGGSGMLTNKASVGRNVMVGAGNLLLDAPIGGEAMLGGESISLGSKTTIDGDLTYMVGEEGKDIQISEDAVISGEVIKKESKQMGFDQEKMSVDVRRGFGAVRGGLQLFSFIGALVVGLVTLMFFKKPAEVVAKTMEKKPFESFGVGLLAFVLAGPLFLIMMATGIGAPLALVLLPLYILDLYFAKMATSYVLGRIALDYLGKNKVSVYATYTLGLIVYYLLRVLPYIGPLTRVIAFFAGLGAMYIPGWEWLKKQKKA